MSAQYDIIFVGGGLANTLAAYRIAHRHPNLRLCLLERGPVLGGEHTWSFHTSDVSAEQMAWLQPFVTYAWPRQEIRFPNRRRVLDVGYNSIASATLHHTASAKFGDAIRLNCPIDTITQHSVITSGGEELTARCVIDGRGLAPSDSLALGYQTFLGLEIETAEPHGQRHPIIMDATIDQLDGYRFVYTLPFADNRILIEDTYYNDTDGYDETALETRIADYAAARGWTISRIVRRENGILPIVLAGDIDAFWDADHSSLPRTGLRAALFHPVTGYSVPDAVRVADLLSCQQAFRHSIDRVPHPQSFGQRVAGAGILPPAQQNAVSRSRTRSAHPCARAFLWTVRTFDFALLCRPHHDRRPDADPGRQTAGADLARSDLFKPALRLGFRQPKCRHGRQIDGVRRHRHIPHRTL